MTATLSPESTQRQKGSGNTITPCGTVKQKKWLASNFEGHEDFVIKGNNGSESEKNGMLEYLTPNLGEALFTINFQHLGIFKLAPEKAEANSDQAKRVRAEMYCEQMTFKFGKGAAGC